MKSNFFGNTFMNRREELTAKDPEGVDLLKLRLPDSSVATIFRIWSIFWLSAFASHPAQAGILWLEVWPILVASYVLLVVIYRRRISTSPLTGMQNKVQLNRLRAARIRFEILFDLFLFVAFTLLHNDRIYTLASHWPGSLLVLGLVFGSYINFAERVSGLSVEMRKIESISSSSRASNMDHDCREQLTKL